MSLRVKLSPYPGLGMRQLEAVGGEMSKVQGIQGGRGRRKGGGRGGTGVGKRTHSRRGRIGR